jgi:PAS domain S-box-containing protein
MAQAELLVSIALLVVAIYIIVRQIAAIRAERALRESNQFAAEIIDNAGEGIIVYDLELRYVVWNRFMEELTDMISEEVVGHRAVEVFPHLREQRVDELLQRAIAGETVQSPDIHYYVPKSDRQGWISAVYRPHYDINGNIAGVIALVRDITERKITGDRVQHLLRGWGRRRIAAQERRQRHVPRQGRGAEHVPDVDAGAQPLDAGADDARERPARRHRTERVRAALPAGARPEDVADRRHRSAAALAPPAPRPDRAGGVHQRGGGARLDRGDGGLGAARGLPRSAPPLRNLWTAARGGEHLARQFREQTLIATIAAALEASHLSCARSCNSRRA